LTRCLKGIASIRRQSGRHASRMELQHYSNAEHKHSIVTVLREQSRQGNSNSAGQALRARPVESCTGFHDCPGCHH